MSPGANDPDGIGDRGGGSAPSLRPARETASPPPSAREAAGTSQDRPGRNEAGGGRAGGGGARNRGGDSAGSERKPASARASAPAEVPPSAPEPDVGELTFAADGHNWIVRVIGRGGGSEIPLLLLGFWPGEASEGDPDREVLVVGATLRALAPMDLDRGFAEAKPARRRPEDTSRSDGDRGRGGRGRRGRQRPPP